MPEKPKQKKSAGKNYVKATGPKLEDNARAILFISTPYDGVDTERSPHCGPRFRATIDYTNRQSVEHLEIVTTAALQEESMIIDHPDWDPDLLQKRVGEIDPEWQKSNAFSLERVTSPHHMSGWLYWTQKKYQSEFQLYRARLEDLYRTNGAFHSAVDETVINFLNKKNRANNDGNRARGQKYHLNELAVYIIWAKIGFHYVVYPENQPKAYEWVYTNIIVKEFGEAYGRWARISHKMSKEEENLIIQEKIIGSSLDLERVELKGPVREFVAGSLKKPQPKTLYTMVILLSSDIQRRLDADPGKAILILMYELNYLTSLLNKMVPGQKTDSESGDLTLALIFTLCDSIKDSIKRDVNSGAIFSDVVHDGIKLLSVLLQDVVDALNHEDLVDECSEKQVVVWNKKSSPVKGKNIFSTSLKLKRSLSALDVHEAIDLYKKLGICG